jgi:hypothetical protein
VARYLVLPVPRDPVEAAESFDEVVLEQYPTWTASDADPMTIIRDAVSVLYADVAELATRAGEELFRYFGRGLANLPPIDELPATGQVTVTAQDTAGPYLVPEGLEIVGRGPLGEQVAFRTLAAVVVPNGATTVVANVEAAEAGAAGNSVSGTAEFSEFVDYLTAVEFLAPTSGGADREGDTPYLDRLVGELALQTPRPIVPNDFAVLARRFGAYRATVIDGYNPADDTSGNPAMVAVSMIDETGNALSGAELTRISGLLDAMREVGFSVPTFNPTHSIIDVDFTATAYPGWEPQTVEDAAIEQLQTYLSSARWGAREDTGEIREWLNEPIVRHLEVAEQLQRVEGLRFVDSLELAIQGDPLAAANVTMPGVAPLPTPGTITGAVTAG